MTPKLTREDRLKIIERVEKGESVSKVCIGAGISRVLFYRWYKKYKEEGLQGLDPGESGRPKEIRSPKSIRKYTILSPNARNLMVREVIEQKQDAAEVAKRYGISRVTLYKWIARYKNDISKGYKPDMSSRKPYIERYFRQVPEKHEQAVIQIVEQHPEWGIRRIVANLPQVGGMPIVGHHGVQNILNRHFLSTYEERMAYTKSRATSVTKGIDEILNKVSDFFRIPQEQRKIFIRTFGGISMAGFSLIVVLGVINFFARSYANAEGVSAVGFGLATVALIMGTIFLLYSFKYYLSIAMVLSFSQGQGRKTTKKGIGLTPDLSHVRLASKPYISVQIPFYNEKYVVERAMQAAINFDYPEYEVILCDDSTDETTSIIANYLKANTAQIYKKTGDGWELTWGDVRPGVTLKHLHRTTRGGYKGGALDLALKLTDPRTEYVSIFDADFVPYPDTLELFLKYFQVEGNRSEVAAVQGYQWHVLNKSENWITRGVRSEYAGSYVIERSGIEIYGGLKQISGSVYMIKKNALQEIGWGTSITEDFELTLRLYNAGYKVLYTPYIQAPAECVSTLRRLTRQRMRWAEGHSFNVKQMFMKLLVNPKLSFAEKFEFVYLSPYYLQAFFFLVGTFCWLLSEAVFKAHLPFWTELWGWSLVLTNMISLPLLNAVGMFLEESGDRDYLGIASFVTLSYILVPFQAYASVKGLLEKEEGPWFRTPKTGRITDVFRRGRFYKFIAGILPGKNFEPVPVAGSPVPQTAHQIDTNYYMNLATANSQFNDFKITPKRLKWLGKAVLVSLLILTISIYSLSNGVPEALATNPATTQYISNTTTSTLTNSWQLLSTTQAQYSTTQLSLGRNAIGSFQYYPGTSNGTSGTMCSSSPNGRGWILDTPFGGGGSIASGSWSFYIKETDTNAGLTGYVNVCVYEVTVSGGSILANTLLYSSGSDSNWPTTDTWNAGASSFTATTSTQTQFNIAAGDYIYVEYWNNVTGKNNAAATSTLYTGSASAPYPSITFPTITIPENELLLVLAAPFIPIVVYLWMERRKFA